MKIALSSYSLRSHVGRDVPIAEFPAFARERFGFDAVEICDFQVPRPDSIQLQKLKDGLEASEVRLISFPISAGDISQADRTKRGYDIRLLELWLDAAAFLGAPIARINSGGGDLDRAIDGYRRLVSYATGAGVQVVMENHGGLSAQRESQQAILEAVPGLGTAPDWGNFREEERYDFLAAMLPRAAIVHAKTLDFDPDGRMTAFGIERCFRIVAESGFDGYLSVEFEGQGDQIDGVERSLALLRELAVETGM